MWFRVLPLAIVVAGVLVRVWHYLGNRSLWLDEAMLARNIVERTPLELLQPLSYDQGAPALFLLLVKGVTLLAGTGELALRFVPLASSITALVVFSFLAQAVLSRWWAPVAVFALAFSHPVVYQAQELKQYSTDVAVAVVLLAGALRALRRETWDRAAVAGYAAAGGVALFLSHPAVFVLAGIGSYFLVAAIRERNRGRWRAVLVVGAVWAALLAVNYVVFLRPLAANSFLREYWTSGFIQLSNPGAAPRLLTSYAYFLGYFGVWKFLVPALAILGVGVAVARRSAPVVVIASVLPFAAVAALLGKYPLADRLALYLAPAVILLAARGGEFLASVRARLLNPVLALALSAPLALSGAKLIAAGQFQREEVKPLLAHLAVKRQANEHVYLYYDMEHPLHYYWGAEADNPKFFLGQGKKARAEPSRYLADIEVMRARGPRVWFVFTHDVAGIEAYFRERMQGRVLDELRTTGAAMFLFEFADAGG